jgi:hypothetical protein
LGVFVFHKASNPCRGKIQMQRTLGQSDYFQYIRVVRSARLKGREKALLNTYIAYYWWQDKAPCIAGFAQLAAWTGTSESTVKRAHKRLVELGWVTAVKYGTYDPLRSYVSVGISDPDYDLAEYAKAHRYSDSGEELAWVEAFLGDQTSSPEASPRRSPWARRNRREQGKVSPTFQPPQKTH